MSKAKLQYARELIQEKQYAKARAILKEIDHPTAHQWLAKLNDIDASKKGRLQPRHIIAIAGGILAIAVLMSAAFLAGRATTDPDVTTIAAILPTNAADSVALAIETSTFSPTVVEPTATEVPPTPAVTDTPRPTRTRIPTLTPRPTAIPTPTFTIQTQQIGPIYSALYDESFSVEVTLRSVEFTKGEGFERLGTGKIYAITEITVRNLGPGALRSISDFSFQMKDANGAVRNASLFLMFVDCEFDMVDLTSGGSISGCIAFEVPDTGSLELIYAPFQYEGLEPGRYISFGIR